MGPRHRQTPNRRIMGVFNKQQAMAGVDSSKLMASNDKPEPEPQPTASRCCRKRRGDKNVEERARKHCGCCKKVKCACCLAIGLPIVIVLSPILLVRRAIFGPMKCSRKCKRSAADTPVVDGEAVETPADIKVDKV